MKCAYDIGKSDTHLYVGLPAIGKVTPTAPVTKPGGAKKKKRAKRPGQTGQWKHEDTPLDEM